MSHVLDTGAVLAFVLGESGADQVTAELDGSVLPTIALTEVCRRIEQIGYRRTAAQLTADLTALGVVIDEALTTADAQRAAALRHSSYRLRAQWTEQDRKAAGGVSTLSTADAQVIAIAERHGVPIMTTDRAWLVIERLTGGFGVKVVCIR
ncbi:PIN domain-containing protein [Sphaerimonospora sp. CA-214678]|uniref:PIN domain-containing protein n=1 Tax=Sphaerimonospora sp. CA-214678 TaxID=3240029 RepID=UPI003D8CFEED